jgi:hypothetical protein
MAESPHVHMGRGIAQMLARPSARLRDIQGREVAMLLTSPIQRRMPFRVAPNSHTGNPSTLVFFIFILKLRI